MFLALYPNRSVPRQPPTVRSLKFCTFFGKKLAPNRTQLVKYACHLQEVCCNEGCCPSRPNYYDSWCFWLFVLAIVLGCYMFCWYCKRIEKQRQRAASRRPVDATSVDRLLETLISNYRRRLAQQCDTSPNLDQVKEAPPGYTDALGMPKPQKMAGDQDVPTYEEAVKTLGD